MSYRYTNIRIVNPSLGLDKIVYRRFWLWWAAHAAAEETLQGGPIISAWLKLFQTHLSDSDVRNLRWRDNLAGSSEMRRAYSAMYGRYFGRAFIASMLGITDFVPLSSKVTSITGGVTVSRKTKGDIPDWIAWDSVAKSYILAEAKGRLTGNEKSFLYGMPACIKSGKAQFGRVEVRDSHARKIKTCNWVVANLWATENRGRRSVSLLWDPVENGEKLFAEEIPQHAIAIRRHRIKNIAMGLGRSKLLQLGAKETGLTLRISIEPSKAGVLDSFTDDMLLGLSEKFESTNLPAIEKSSQERHEDVYVAALITPLGVRPILDLLDLEAARNVQRQVRKANEAAMIYGLSTNALTTLEYNQALWLSDGGIVSSDGAGLFNIKEIEFDES